MRLIRLASIFAEDRPPTESDDGLAALTRSIEQVGLLDPITVHKTEGGYRLVAGYRRLIACRRLGWVLIPANVSTPPPLAAFYRKGNFERSDRIGTVDLERFVGVLGGEQARPAGGDAARVELLRDAVGHLTGINALKLLAIEDKDLRASVRESIVRLGEWLAPFGDPARD